MPINPSKLILPAVSLTAIAFAANYFIQHHYEESTDDAFITGQIALVSSKIPGTVKSVNIRDNQWVDAGNTLFELDKTSLQIKRDKAAASLAAIESATEIANYALENTLVTAPSNLDSAKAQVASTKALLDQAKSDLFRIDSLNRQYRSQEQMDHAKATELSARASHQDASARLKAAGMASNVILSAKANTKQISAQRQQAVMDLQQADLELSYANIFAPFAGKVTTRSGDIGAHVEPGQTLLYLVSDQLWVLAYYKETQLKNIKPGQKAIIRIDAYDVTLTGRVDSIQSGTGAFFSPFPTQNSTGNFVKVVQRVPVKIVFDKPLDRNLAIGPGLSVVPTIMTEDSWKNDH